MKTFVVGDIHGTWRALRQCFERSRFSATEDRLIVLGDVCDGYPEVRQVFDELLSLDHCTMVIGNHDIWALDWALTGAQPDIWTSQGGIQTIASYNGGPMPAEHRDFLLHAVPYLELDGRLFVHGGCNPAVDLARQTAESLVWDRSLIQTAWKRHRAGRKIVFGGYRDIFLGHTPTEVFGTDQPVHFCNVWDLDTGAGWSGRLTMMEVESGLWYQSDPTPGLYGGIQGRGRGGDKGQGQGQNQ